MRQGNRPTAELSVKSRATRLAARIASGRCRLVLVAIATAFWPAVAATSSAHANSVSGLSFRLVDLSPLAGDVSSGATDVNDVGHVAGYSSDSTTFRAVLWAAGRVRNLGTLPAPYDAGSVAYSVNDRKGLAKAGTARATATRSSGGTAR